MYNRKLRRFGDIVLYFDVLYLILKGVIWVIKIPLLPGQFRKLELKVVGILAISAKWTRVKESEVPKQVAKSSLNWFVPSELNRIIA
mgnify:CR=1 FL=1